ncbi:multi-sensor hybrid histidine kinase [Rhodomicrobium vannielii ATCC 17100]|uniref:histidine kinase n=3 Tax=Rhodomicrobium TaxID=1068 RepID=E3I0B1_RHOVT|nr:response regulator [Rhodomicrobium vannielii]ADP72229.1 multi-sensor hybrid histidine kinase [Rhodomicrobium vannielii ATCC 17100]
MGTRSMALAQKTPHWGSIAVGAGVTAAVTLSLAGQGEIALAIFAFVGAAAGVLFATGQIQFKQPEGTTGDPGLDVVRALPGAIAVTNRKGIIQGGSDNFIAIVGGLGVDQNLSRLGDRDRETAAAVFRLLSAGREGRKHTETIVLPNLGGGETAVLGIAPLGERGNRTQLFLWHIEQFRKDVSGERRTPDLLEMLPVAALTVNKDLSVQSANKAFEKLAGGSPIGREAWSLFRTRRGNPLTRARLRDVIAKAGGNIQVQVVSANGFTRQACLHLADTLNGGGVWLVTPADAAAGRLDEAFETIVASAPDAMAILNTKGVILGANGVFRQIFGAEGVDGSQVADIHGKALTSLLAESSAQTVKEKIAALLSTPDANPAPVELHAVPKDAINRRIRIMIFPAADGNHLVVTAAEPVASALTDEKAAQGQKLQAVGELAGGIAHDFNNLLTAIIGFSDLLLRRFRASDPAFKDLMNIKNNATRAAELVKQILAYSRRQTLRPAILRLTDVIEEFQATMGRTLGEKVKAKVQHGRDLWFVKADEGQIFQVIMNLAVNARDAMPEGGDITISTANVSERESLLLKERGVERGEYVTVEVRDSGTGIKPEHLEKIFDPFFSTKEVGKGTGLGLSTVYGIVKQTGGTILVDSEMGKGSSFRIFLPRYVETELDLKALETRGEAPEQTIDLTGKATVLLVEDEDAVRSFASRALATRGYTVLEAASGVEALEIMDRHEGQVDLVVSDVVMPEMDGPTLLRHLRQRNPDIRIIFMSGYAEEAFRKNLSADENFVFLPKPFTLKKLAETVKAAAA